MRLKTFLTAAVFPDNTFLINHNYYYVYYSPYKVLLYFIFHRLQDVDFVLIFISVLLHLQFRIKKVFKLKCNVPIMCRR